MGAPPDLNLGDGNSSRRGLEAEGVTGEGRF